MSNMSIFIHSALSSTTDEFVRETIQTKLELGEVERVDLVSRKDKNGRDYKMVYVHMKSWNTNSRVETILHEIESLGKTTVYISKKSYWVLSKNTYVPPPPKTNPKLVREDAVYDTPPTPPARLERCTTTVACPPHPRRLQRENTEPNGHTMQYYYNPDGGGGMMPFGNGLARYPSMMGTPNQSPYCPPPPPLVRCDRPCLYRNESSDIEDNLDCCSRNLFNNVTEKLVDDGYVSKLEQENAWLHSVIAGLEQEIAVAKYDRMR